jgi:hypothetical protein
MFTINISKYLKNKSKVNGQVISSLILDLYNTYKFKDILFVRTCTTGAWLDNLLIDNQDINRILYYTDNINTPNNTPHKSTQMIHSNELETQLLSLNKTFDLICIDGCHEYKVSSRDFKLISSLLNETGILISHDCYPWNKTVANPVYTPGSWCGETYIAFIEFAYNNPELYYTVLNVDTGIGILSKTQIKNLSNSLDKNKQIHLLDLHKKSKNPYSYFTKYSKGIINSHSP